MDNQNNIKIHPLWYICITVRTIIAAIPLLYNHLLNKNYKINIIKNISLITQIIILLMGLGFLIKSIFGSNNEKQIEKVFWHNTRIIHAIIYIYAAIIFVNYKMSSSLLFIDVLFSIIYSFNSGHFHF